MIEQFEQAGRAIADPSRLRILKMLEPEELYVCQVTAVLGLAPATVSKHLSLLRAAGLVSQRKADGGSITGWPSVRSIPTPRRCWRW